MITREQLRTYESFNGDIDGWVRTRQSMDSAMADQDWRLIGDILQRLRIVAHGLGSNAFEAQALELLDELAPDEFVRDRLLKLAATLV